MLSAAALTAARETSWTDLTREPSFPELPNYTSKTSLMNFSDNYIMPCVQAGAVYEHKYLLGTSMARPAIARKLVEIARKEKLLLSATVLPVKVTIKFVLNSVSKLLHLI